MLSPSYIILRFLRQSLNSVDLDEVAHYEPPHQDLCCLQIMLFSSLVAGFFKVTAWAIVLDLIRENNIVFDGMFT